MQRCRSLLKTQINRRFPIVKFGCKVNRQSAKMKSSPKTHPGMKSWIAAALVLAAVATANAQSNQPPLTMPDRSRGR
jgi:hypothetical protein